MPYFLRFRPSAAGILTVSLGVAGPACAADLPTTLSPPESFAGIADTNQRSAAMFTELGKVLMHPRCVNCHPAGDRPHQTDLGRPHQPPVWRGERGAAVRARGD